MAPAENIPHDLGELFLDSIFQDQLVSQITDTMDTTAIPTPSACTADFCLIPVCFSKSGCLGLLLPSWSHTPHSLALKDTHIFQIGTPTASVSAQIADVQRLLKKSGLKY